MPMKCNSVYTTNKTKAQHMSRLCRENRRSDRDVFLAWYNLANTPIPPTRRGKRQKPAGKATEDEKVLVVATI